jgi:hypothetical protein
MPTCWHSSKASRQPSARGREPDREEVNYPLLFEPAGSAMTALSAAIISRAAGHEPAAAGSHATMGAPCKPRSGLLSRRHHEAPLAPPARRGG